MYSSRLLPFRSGPARPASPALRLSTRLGLLFLLGVVAGCAGPRTVPAPPTSPAASADAVRVALTDLVQACAEEPCAFEFASGVAVDSVALDAEARRLDVRFNDALAYRPFRPATVEALYDLVRERLAPLLPGYDIELRANAQPVEALVPNYYRDEREIDRSRLALPEERPVPLVRALDRPWEPTAGLAGRYVALWPSHGWYYEPKLDRWEWQRARLFRTVEDLIPLAFTQPYLVPMLERAGATVFLPRERDLQTHEVIVDNDGPDPGYAEAGPWRTASGEGYAVGDLPYTEGVNPFRLGTSRVVEAAADSTAGIRWVPDIPETGEYAVRVAYTRDPRHVEDAAYTVYHAGGATRFLVNQQIGGGTWIYLGTFRFEAGQHPNSGSVVSTNASATPGRLVSADAVRFGGGMGSVARGGETSGRPRWVEAARYSMQTDGMPDSLVYSLSGGENDYTDDYRGRGEWVNYLRGAPFGPTRDRETPGLGLPIDLSLAFHTDAGISRSDTTIGTLLIYSTEGADAADAPPVTIRPIPPRPEKPAADPAKFFPDGVSRLANRDFADLLQTQLVDDLRDLYDPAWRRRPLWDRDYSEAVRPNVPAALLELLSQQNLLDMQFALDPRFRFDVSRSIYKAILRFLATQHGTEYVVQPLPVSQFQALLAGTDGVALRWQPTPDPLEPTAGADAYVVYSRTERGGWDNGRRVDNTEVTLRGLEPGVIMSYRVAAVNAGGESAPSEALAVLHLPEGNSPVLVVNGFDRVAPPATIETDSLAGFAGWRDQGVPDRYDLGTTGAQFNFDRNDEWTDDDAPGWGSSYGDLETTVLPGNTFDFPLVHGESLRAAGVAFASTSAAALAAGTVDANPYRSLDLILGEQTTTPWPKPTRAPQFEALPAALRDALDRFCGSGGGLFVSGSYVGTDVFKGQPEDAPGPAFARETLGIQWRTDHAATTGGLVSPNDTLLPKGTTFQFTTEVDPAIYAVEAPDAIEPADSTGATVLRYTENNMSAAVASRGACPAVVFGFPFETILTREDRDAVMRAVLRYLALPPEP